MMSSFLSCKFEKNSNEGPSSTNHEQRQSQNQVKSTICPLSFCIIVNKLYRQEDGPTDRQTDTKSLLYTTK